MAVYDKSGQLVVLVEVKKTRETDGEWAMELRRNILAHGDCPNVPYFLLALPDRFYLWKNAGNAVELVPPTYDVDPVPFLSSYYEKAGVSPEVMDGDSFEFIVLWWLGDVVHANPAAVRSAQEWLDETGLLNAVEGGHVAAEALV